MMKMEDGRVLSFIVKKQPPPSSVSKSISSVSKKHLERFTKGLPHGFDEITCDFISRDQFPVGYTFDGYWLDIGRPDDYDRANKERAALESSLLARIQ
jgi:mannose-1-phosphate guanylyltransferase